MIEYYLYLLWLCKQKDHQDREARESQTRADDVSREMLGLYQAVQKAEE